MTAPVQTPINSSTANGVSTVFPFSFMILGEDDLGVTVDGTLQTSGYTVSGVGDVAGGDVTFSVAPAADAEVIIYRDPVLSREADYQQFGDWNANNVNPDFDRLWLSIQSLKATSLRVPSGDSETGEMVLPNVATRASKYAGYAGDGRPTVYDPALGLVTSSANVTFLPDGTGAVATDVQTKLRNTQKTPEDNGAVGDGTTDDSDAIEDWLSQGGKLYGGLGKIYKITREISVVSNTFIDWRGSSLKCTSRIRSYLYGNGITRFHMWGSGEHDLGQTVLATYSSGDYAAAVYRGSCYNQLAFFENSSDIYIRDIKAKNLYTSALQFYNCTGYIDILDSKFTSPVQAQTQNANHILVQTCSADVTVANCKFINAAPSSPDYGVVAFVCSGTSGAVNIHHNTLEYCGRNTVGTHQLAPISFYGDHNHADVHHNKINNCLYQAVRFTSCWNYTFAHNYVTSAAVADATEQLVSIESSWFGGARNGCVNGKIAFNTLKEGTSTTRIAIVAASGDYAVPISGLTIQGNYIQGMRYAFDLQGAFERVKFIDNPDISGTNGNSIYVHRNASSTAAHGVTEAQSYCRELEISRNCLAALGTAHASAIPIFVDLTAYTGTVGVLRIENNDMQSTNLTATLGVGVRGPTAGAPAATQGHAIIRGNTVDKYDIGVQPLNLYSLSMRDNECGGCTTPFDAISGVNSVERSGNRYTKNGGLTFRASMTAGTVTFTAPEVRTGDNIMISRQGLAGTTGDLYVQTITNATSFVVSSTNVLDTSVVTAIIEH